MSKWEKLIASILNGDSSLSFESLSKALERVGYTKHQPHKGSSHYTFRKEGCLPITIPKHKPLNKVYISMVAEIVKESLEEQEAEQQEKQDEQEAHNENE